MHAYKIKIMDNLRIKIGDKHDPGTLEYEEIVYLFMILIAIDAGL